MTRGGVLCVADLDAEDGSFHGPHVRDVHHGFPRDELARMLTAAGFAEPRFSTVYAVPRERAGRTRRYPVFLAVSEAE